MIKLLKNRMPRFRIVYVEHDGDPCHWQLQKRVCWIFWVNACGNVSSATTAANELLSQLKPN